MFHFDHDYDPIAPCGAELLAEFGLDARAVRDALADDRARRAAPTAKSRLTGAGAKRVKGEREGIGSETSRPRPLANASSSSRSKENRKWRSE